MQFNNKEFEKGIRESTKSLKDLKESLELKNASKSLNGLNEAAKAFSLDGIADGVEFLTKRFSNLGIIGMSLLNNLTTSAYNFAKSMKNQVFDSIMEGGKRRALNIEQAKFQFKGLGMDVEQAMDDALYAVKGTAYGLDEAAKAAAQLGATGIELGDDMKGALRAVSGVAAMTNSGYDDISRVFIAVAGNGRLMGQQLLSLSSRGINAAAVLAKSMGKSEAVVRKMVSAGQIDFETFYKAMDNAFGEHATAANQTYAGSLSNVKAALSRLGASIKAPQLDNLRDIFNKLIPVIDDLLEILQPTIDSFNELFTIASKGLIAKLENAKFRGLYTGLESVKNVLTGIASVIKPIKDAFSDIFPAKTSGEMLVFSRNLFELTKKFKMGVTSSENLRKTFKGLFAILDIGIMLISAVVKGFAELIGVFAPATKGILGFTGGLGDFVVSIRDAIKQSDIFNRVVQKITKFLKPFVKVVRDLIGGFGELDMTPVENAADGIMTSFQPIKALGQGIKTVFEGVIKVLGRVGTFIGGIVDATKHLASELWNGITSAFRDGDSSQLLSIINTGLFASIVIAIQELSKKLLDLNFGFRKIVFKMTRVLDDVRVSLQAWQTSLQAKALRDIAVAIAILSGALLVLASIDPKKLTTALGGITVLFVELIGAMAVFQKTSNMKGVGVKLTIMSANMIAISTAVLILAGAMKVLGSLNMESITSGLIAVGVLLAMTIKTAESMSSTGGRMLKGATNMIFFATGIQILASAVKKLGETDPEVLTQGLLGVGVILAELGIFMKMTDFEGMGISTGLGIIALSSALIILGKAVKTFGELDTSTLIQGLIGVGVVLGEIAIFTKLTGDAKRVLSTSVGIIALGAAMIIFSKAITNLGSLSWESLAKGLIGMAGALASITIAMNLLPKGMISKSTGMLAISAALLVLSNAMTKMGSMSWDEIARGLVTLSGALAAITISMNLMTGSLAGAAALVVISASLALLAPILVLFGNMDIENIGKSLLMLAGVLGIFGAAGLLLGPITPILLGLSGSVALFGVGALAAGVGISALAVGLGALAGTFAVAGKSLTGVIKSLVELIPLVLKNVGKGIVELIKILADSAPKLVRAISDIITALLKAIRNNVPDFVDTIIDLLLTLLKTIDKYLPEFIKRGMSILMSFLEGIRDNIKDVVAVGIDIAINFIDGIASKLGDVIQAGFDLLLAFIDGITDAINKNTKPLIESIGGLIKSMLKAALTIVTAPFKGAASIGKNIVSGIIDGITGMAKNAVKAVKGFGQGILDAMKDKLGIKSPSRVFRDEIGANLCFGVIDGFKKGMDDVYRQSREVGGQTTVSMADGVKEKTPTLKKAAGEASKSAYQATKEWIDKQKKYHDLSLDDQISKWKETLTKYKKGTDEYFDIMNEIELAEKQKRADSFNHSREWIAKEKEMKNLSLLDEYEAWERVQARFALGTEERKEADKELFRVRNELISEMKRIDEDYYSSVQQVQADLKRDIEDLTKAYEDAVKDRTAAIVNSYGLFDEVAKESDVSGDTLMDNLEDQVKALDTWSKEFERLSAKGVDEGLLEELRQMGPKALPEIQALNRMTDLELTYYASLWKTKHSIAKKQAIKELEDLKTETKTKIEELEKTADKELDSLKSMWKTQTEKLTKTTIDAYTEMGDDIILSLKSLKKRSKEEIEANNKGIKNVITQENWQALGSNIVEGITKGINNNNSVSNLMSSMVNLARRTRSTFEQELQINSPSQVFANLGKFIIEGLATGLQDRKGYGLIRDTMSRIADVLDSDMDMSPTIKPVLDLSNVKEGLKSAFMNDQILAANSTRQSRTISTQGSQPIEERLTPSDNSTTTINNEYTIHATIREEADIRKLNEDMYKLQRQNSRGKGVVLNARF